MIHFYSELKKYYKSMIFSFFIAMTANGLALIPPIIMQILIDEAIPGGNLKDMVLLVVFFISLPVVNGIVYALYNTWGAMKCRRASYTINSEIIDRILWQPISFHTENSSAKLAAEWSRSAIDYTYLWVNDIPQTIATFLTAVIAFGYLLYISPWIALSQLFLLPVLMVPMVAVKKVIRHYSKILFSANNSIQAMLIEAFRGIKTVKNFCLEKNILKKYQDLYHNVDKCFRKEALIESFQGTVASRFIMSVFVGIAFIIGIVNIMQGSMTIGLLVSGLNFINKFHDGVYSLMSTNLNFSKQLGTFEVLFQYRCLEKEGSGAANIPKEFLQRELEVCNLSFSYTSDTVILNHLSLTVPANSWIGIKGSSGIGKTTLLDLITRIEKSEKSIFLDGVDISTISLEWYRNHIAVLSQVPFLFKDTIRNNFLYANEKLSDREIYEFLDFVQLTELVHTLPDGLDAQLGEDGTDISGGEKQRLSLAIALATGRKFLILDEATSNLDEALEISIAERLHDMVQEQRLTILSVSHRPNFHKYCDKIIEL